jgi:acetyl esterase/lipase
MLALALAACCATTSAGDAPADPLAGISVRRDVRYATAPSGALTLDVYRPAGARAPSPVLLFFHGGGWMMGSRRDALPEVHPAPSYGERTWPSMLPYLRRGVAVVSPDYRLTAVAPAPAAVEDAEHALAWVSAHGAEHGLDPTRIVTIGASAGGHLALMVAFGAEGRQRVRGAIDLYGITDLPPLLETPQARPWATDWIGRRADASDLARRMSPLALVRAGSPPVLIVHSDADAVVPYDQAERLARALRGAGVISTLPSSGQRSEARFPGRTTQLPRATSRCCWTGCGAKSTATGAGSPRRNCAGRSRARV